MKVSVDIPPTWLVLFICLAWLLARLLPIGPSLDLPFVQGLATALIWGGILLIVLAAFEFWRARTTIIPHNTPSRLITSGIFRFSRNPIYLADALILSGFVLRFDAILALPLILLFVWLIQTRFIVTEEERMRAAFGPEFLSYEQKVRRWV